MIERIDMKVNFNKDKTEAVLLAEVLLQEIRPAPEDRMVVTYSEILAKFKSLYPNYEPVIIDGPVTLFDFKTKIECCGTYRVKLTNKSKPQKRTKQNKAPSTFKTSTKKTGA